MPRITISYRRDDSGVITGRIFDRLATHYGRDSVFRDIDNIPPGVDFRKHIDKVLDGSDIVLAIVGPKWVGPRANQSRLANAADPVRVEIETVLRKGKPLIPVLVQRASMPRVEQLPGSLHEFAFRNAVDVDAGRDFDHHMAGLIRSMDRMLGVAVEPEAVDRAEPIAAIEPESRPQPTPDDIDALRARNASLAAQVAALSTAREQAAQTGARLRDDIESAPLQAKSAVAVGPKSIRAHRAAIVLLAIALLVSLGSIAFIQKPASEDSAAKLGELQQQVARLSAARDADQARLKQKDDQIAEFSKKTSSQDKIPSASAQGSLRDGDLAYNNRNYTEALSQYRLAANTGDPVAQYRLGVLYENGEGAARDLSQARYWYNLAAEQGHQDAKAGLRRVSGK